MLLRNLRARGKSVLHLEYRTSRGCAKHTFSFNRKVLRNKHMFDLEKGINDQTMLKNVKTVFKVIVIKVIIFS